MLDISLTYCHSEKRTFNERRLIYIILSSHLNENQNNNL